jgi:hypothetical protein
VKRTLLVEKQTRGCCAAAASRVLDERDKGWWQIVFTVRLLTPDKGIISLGLPRGWRSRAGVEMKPVLLTAHAVNV